MKIVDAKVFVGGPSKNYVTLKITTDQGIYGLGDATLNTRETLPAALLEEYLIPNLIGMDPRNSEDVWQFFYRGAYFRRGPIAMAAFGAIDMALWDIKGKLANLPVYQLLGGKSRDAAMVYAHATGADLPDLMDSIAYYVEQGYKAVRVQCGVPGMATAGYGVSDAKGKTKNFITDFGGVRPKVEIWDTDRYMRYMPGALAEIRERFGPELKILHDVHHRLLPREAAEFAKSVESVKLFWLEDPTPAEDQDALKFIRQHSTVPIAMAASHLCGEWLISRECTMYARVFMERRVIHHCAWRRKHTSMPGRLIQWFAWKTGLCGTIKASSILFVGILRENLYRFF